MGNETSTAAGAQAGGSYIATEVVHASQVQGAWQQHAHDYTDRNEHEQNEQEQCNDSAIGDTPSKTLRKEKEQLKRELEAARPRPKVVPTPNTKAHLSSADVRRKQFRAYKEQTEQVCKITLNFEAKPVLVRVRAAWFVLH